MNTRRTHCHSYRHGRAGAFRDRGGNFPEARGQSAGRPRGFHQVPPDTVMTVREGQATGKTADSVTLRPAGTPARNPRGQGTVKWHGRASGPFQTGGRLAALPPAIPATPPGRCGASSRLEIGE